MGFWPPWNHTMVPTLRILQAWLQLSFEFSSYHNMLNTLSVQLYEPFHLQHSDLRSDWYSLCGCKLTAAFKWKSLVFDSDSTNLGCIANLQAGGEWAAKTARFTYWACHDRIRTPILNCRHSGEVEMVGFWWRNQTNCNRLGFHVVKPIAKIRFRSQLQPRTVPAGWNHC